MVAIGEDRVDSRLRLDDHAGDAGRELAPRTSHHPRWPEPIGTGVLERRRDGVHARRRLVSPSDTTIDVRPRQRSDEVRAPVASDEKRRREHVRDLISIAMDIIPPIDCPVS